MKLNWLLVFIPIAIALDWSGVEPDPGLRRRRRWRSFPSPG